MEKISVRAPKHHSDVFSEEFHGVLTLTTMSTSCDMSGNAPSSAHTIECGHCSSAALTSDDFAAALWHTDMPADTCQLEAVLQASATELDAAASDGTAVPSCLPSTAVLQAITEAAGHLQDLAARWAQVMPAVHADVSPRSIGAEPVHAALSACQAPAWFPHAAQAAQLCLPQRVASPCPLHIPRAGHTPVYAALPVPHDAVQTHFHTPALQAMACTAASPTSTAAAALWQVVHALWLCACDSAGPAPYTLRACCAKVDAWATTNCPQLARACHQAGASSAAPVVSFLATAGVSALSPGATLQFWAWVLQPAWALCPTPASLAQHWSHALLSEHQARACAVACHALAMVESAWPSEPWPYPQVVAQVRSALQQHWQHMRAAMP